jgi:hypothetical protein
MTALAAGGARGQPRQQLRRPGQVLRDVPVLGVLEGSGQPRIGPGRLLHRGKVSAGEGLRQLDHCALDHAAVQQLGHQRAGTPGEGGVMLGPQLAQHQHRGAVRIDQ